MCAVDYATAIKMETELMRKPQYNEQRTEMAIDMVRAHIHAPSTNTYMMKPIITMVAIAKRTRACSIDLKMAAAFLPIRYTRTCVHENICV